MRSETYESILEQIRATPDTPPESIAECGHCHFRWNDDRMSADATLQTHAYRTESAREYAIAQVITIAHC